MGINASSAICFCSNCLHVYHKSCLAPILRMKSPCPICRKSNFIPRGLDDWLNTLKIEESEREEPMELEYTDPKKPKFDLESFMIGDKKWFQEYLEEVYGDSLTDKVTNPPLKEKELTLSEERKKEVTSYLKRCGLVPST